MKKNRDIFIIFLLFLLLFSTTTGPAQNQLNIHFDQREKQLQPRTIYVDDDNINGPWYGTLEFPFRYIQTGLGAAFDGDTVYVFDGLYEENSMEIHNSITIQGENLKNTIIDGKGYSIIYVMKGNVVFTGFTFRNAQEYCGIVINSHHITITNNIITQCDRGICMPPDYSNNVTICNNIFENNQEEGIQIWWGNNYLTIANNTFRDNPTGIEITGDNHDIIIENNHFIKNKNGVNIRTDDRDNAFFFTITNNNFEDNKNTGLSLDFIINSFISQNTFINNNIGLSFNKAKGNQITKNNFINNNKHVTFRYYEKRERCYFRYNYWDNWFKFFPIPKPIKGYVRNYNMWYEPYDRTMFNIDWHPALKPYDIEVLI